MISRTQNFKNSVTFQKLTFETPGFKKNKQESMLRTLQDLAENDPKTVKYIKALESLGINLEVGMTGKNEFSASALNADEAYAVPGFNKKVIKNTYDVIIFALEMGLEMAKQKLKSQ